MYESSRCKQDGNDVGTVNKDEEGEQEEGALASAPIVFMSSKSAFQICRHQSAVEGVRQYGS